MGVERERVLFAASLRGDAAEGKEASSAMFRLCATEGLNFLLTGVDAGKVFATTGGEWLLLAKMLLCVMNGDAALEYAAVVVS
jgi:hypothetical protein